MVTFITMSLCGCESGKQASNEQNHDKLVVQPAKPAPASKRMGAHSGQDPHAKLTPDKHIRVALQHQAEGRSELAMDTLHRAIAQYPGQASLHGVRGSLLLEQGHSAAALADLNLAVQLEPHDPVYLTNRAQAYRSFGRTEDAISDLDSAIELDSHFIAARFNRGSLAYNAGNFSQALADFDVCINTEPDYAAPYFNRASVHESMGNRAQAIADLKQFLDIANNDQWKQAAQALLKKWQSTNNPGIATESDSS